MGLCLIAIVAVFVSLFCHKENRIGITFIWGGDRVLKMTLISYPAQSIFSFSFINSCYIVGLSGLVAEKTNSYHSAFRFASGIEFLGLLNFGLYLCLKEKLSRKRIEIEPEPSPLATLCVIEKETVL